MIAGLVAGYGGTLHPTDRLLLHVLGALDPRVNGLPGHALEWRPHAEDRTDGSGEEQLLSFLQEGRLFEPARLALSCAHFGYTQMGNSVPREAVELAIARTDNYNGRNEEEEQCGCGRMGCGEAWQAYDASWVLTVARTAGLCGGQDGFSAAQVDCRKLIEVHLLPYFLACLSTPYLPIRRLAYGLLHRYYVLLKVSIGKHVLFLVIVSSLLILLSARMLTLKRDHR